MVNTETIQWRSVSDSLPESTDTVLVKMKAGGVFESFCQGRHWNIYGATGLIRLKGTVVFWAPMPVGPSTRKSAA
jgi:hypothetical protein